VFNKRRLLVFLLDIFFIAAAFSLAFLLRFDFAPPPAETAFYLKQLLLILTIKPVVFLFSKLYRSIWRYASLQDAVEIFKTVTIASTAVFAAMLFFHRYEHFSRAVFLIDWILLFTALSASRLIWRTYRETFIIPRTERSLNNASRTLIVGAGQAGSMLLKEIRGMAGSPYHLVGFVDDEPGKQGRSLNGVPVLGTMSELKTLVLQHQVEKVIIAIPSASRSTIRAIVRSCETAKVRFKTLPGLGQILLGKVSVSQIKDVELEDLLGRDPVELDETGIGNYLTDRRVFVSGAAGSIGSEICRQIARYKPCKLIIIDSAETPLFHIERELVASYPELRVIPVIADVRNKGRIEVLFESLQPDVVFHAAAYKHVPLMEYNPLEAVANNIGGTKVLADAADSFGVRNFVMVSTDKAVNPTNVMGATKRIAELYVQALSQKSQTCFTTVRFGNVLGSNGSVIPIFREQIEKGGPITITHPDVIRYFMTIPEASQLVLQSGCLGNSGEIFVLDMGEPVKIVEMAEELVRLSGMTPHVDIEFAYTGLRPGEKLYEELFFRGEDILDTAHEKIHVLASSSQKHEQLCPQIELLLRTARDNDTGRLLAMLCEIVPEYTLSAHGRQNLKTIDPTGQG